jgi:glycosyltransferase involved in cell wall biosynthesis
MKNILFVEGESPCANFITRRVDHLSANGGVKVIILLDFDDPYLYKNPNVKYLVKLNFKKFFIKSISRFFLTLPYSLTRTLRLFTYIPRPNSKLFQKIYLAILYNEIGSVKFDVIHCQYIGQFSLIEWISKMTRKPIISSVRGAQVTFMIDSNPQYKNVIKYAFENSAIIHCVSDSLKNRCIELGANEEKILVNYNGINSDLFKPSKEKKFQGPIEFITVGSLGWRKGVVFQLLAIKSLTNLLPEIELNLKIIGEGDDFNYLKYYVKSMGISKYIQFLGPKSESEIVSLLKSSHVYLTTSVAEGLSNSVMEALSSGVPVISFNCEGVGELIQDNVNGFAVDFGDLPKYVEKMMLFAKDRQLLEVFSLNARSYMEQKFNISSHVADMINVYNKF